MIYRAYHGRPLVGPDGELEDLNPIYRDTTFSAESNDDASDICDAIAVEVLAEVGPPLAAVIYNLSLGDGGLDA